METRTRLDADDLTQLIAAIFAYNEMEVIRVDFDVRGGTVAAEVVCESKCLKVRTTPERNQEDVLEKMTDDVLSRMRSR